MYAFLIVIYVLNTTERPRVITDTQTHCSVDECVCAQPCVCV